MTIFYIAMVVIVIVISSIASKKQKDAAHTQRNDTRERNPADFVASDVSAPAKDETPRPAYRHVVLPSYESNHAHQETSLTGVQQCPTAGTLKIVPASHSEGDMRAVQTSGLSLSLNGDEVTKAILYAEILGRPKAHRTR